jgi:D-sedoheptulose 7-phosphate isomerase
MEPTMTDNNLIEIYKNESIEVMKNISTKQIAEFVDIVYEVYENEGKIFACGNGGNVAYVGNLVVDLNMHPFVSDDKTESNSKRNGFHCVNLCDCSATLTGISNDLGYEHIFEQQLRYQASPGDVFFGISGSGNSKNVIRAMEYAKSVGMKTVMITRNAKSKSSQADLVIEVVGNSIFPGQTGKNNNNFHFEDSISKVTHIAVGLLKRRVQNES